MPMQPAKRLIWTAALLAPLVLAGCSGISNPFASSPPPPPPTPAGPPVAMGGRWMLAAANGGQCGMNFTAAPQAMSGTIAPEGGCPGAFFTSRKWAFDQGALVLYDHKEQPLARLAVIQGGYFEGTAVSGVPLRMSR